jgi:hypothetical protein
VPFLYDFAEICRFLFVLPLLIAAEGMVGPWLIHVIAHFRKLVSEVDTDKFERNIALAMHSSDSIPVELICPSYDLI